MSHLASFHESRGAGMRLQPKHVGADGPPTIMNYGGMVLVHHRRTLHVLFAPDVDTILSPWPLRRPHTRGNQ